MTGIVNDEPTSGAGLVDPMLAAPAKPKRPHLLPRALRLPLYLVGGMAILAIGRIYTGVDQLTSAGMFRSALLLSVPIALAGLGGLWSERAGVVNIGLEGMMVLGSWFGAYGAIEWGAWQGILLGAVAGAVGGLIHAVATVTFGVDHIISGVAINLLGVGLTNFLTTVTWEGATQSSPSFDPTVGQARLPWFLNDPLFWVFDKLGVSFGDWLTSVGAKKWFLVSDLANLSRGVLIDMSWLVFIGLLLFPISWYVLWKTPLGLRLRSVGEDPEAADSLGVKVYGMKYLAVGVSGMMAGLGGVTLTYVFSGQFSSGSNNGRGFIGLAAMIFGNWRPGGLVAGAGLFGFMDAMQSQVDRTSHALLVVVGMILLVLGLVLLGRKASRSALGALIGLAAVLFLVLDNVRIDGTIPLPLVQGTPYALLVLLAGAIWIAVVRQLVGGDGWLSPAIVVTLAGLFWVWYEHTEELPREFIPYFPHIATLLVLVFASQRLRMPAADGKIYRRGGR